MTEAAYKSWLKRARFTQKLLRGVQYIRAQFEFWRDFQEFASMTRLVPSRFALDWRHRYPCLNDKTPTTGFDRHYVYHTAWAARILAQNLPETHVDISSTLYFSGIVSAFVSVNFFDYRPADILLDNLTSEHADLLDLPFENGSVHSMSCMHVIEHIGLGRYGDPLDPEGDLKAMAELKRVMAPGGSLLLVVPVGRPKIAFNAHRIYSHTQVMREFGGFQLQQFNLIPDVGYMVTNAAPSLVDDQEYGCGCFWFQRCAVVG